MSLSRVLSFFYHQSGIPWERRKVTVQNVGNLHKVHGMATQRCAGILGKPPEGKKINEGEQQVLLLLLLHANEQ